MAKRREFNVFSLSFLDIMSCGFGAVILIFIVIQHSTETTPQDTNIELMAEVKKLEMEVLEGTKNLVELKTTVDETDDEIVTTEGLILEILEQIKALRASIAKITDSGASQSESIEALKTEIKELEIETASLQGSVSGDEKSGTSTRTFLGEGDRQYLTGIHLGGEHVLILIDASSSMLAKTIVNVIRRRNMGDDQIRASVKWQRAIKTVEWIVANVPKESNMQIISFNETAKSLIVDSEDNWVKATDREDVDTAIEDLKQLIPKGGTSLHHAFAKARKLSPAPDNIFLIVDSLPTMAFERTKDTLIDGNDRVKIFSDALDELPPNTAVNVILFPMEGDPIAAPSFWRLAQITGGSFLSPAEDWP
ncbi:MAG: hypothetical protein ACI9FB_004667 [Candidatus Azotimanducaceae bacterium]|jgi:hypothetical protein